jgi:hypothetical protein
MSDRPVADREPLSAAMDEAVSRIRKAHSMNHVPTSVVSYCGESDGISAVYCETGILLRALDAARSTAPATGPGLDALLDSDDFRDRHERAFRDHILGIVPPLSTHDNGADDHACDDLCSAAIIDRLLGKRPLNEYAAYRHDLLGRERATDIRPAAVDWPKP